MSKIISLALLFLILTIILLIGNLKGVSAQTGPPGCFLQGLDTSTTPPQLTRGKFYKVTLVNLTPDQEYYIFFDSAALKLGKTDGSGNLFNAPMNISLNSTIGEGNHNVKFATNPIGTNASCIPVGTEPFGTVNVIDPPPNSSGYYYNHDARQCLSCNTSDTFCNFIDLEACQNYASTIPAAFVIRMSPAEIGDLKINELKEVTLSNLTINTNYYWKESQLSGTVISPSCLAPPCYTQIFAACYFADGSGVIKQTIGPISKSGYYRLEIFLANSGASCSPTGDVLFEHKFSVGGATGIDCCVLPNIVYDEGKEMCKDQIVIRPTTIFVPTECSKTDPKTYCEPKSLKCFQNKTWVNTPVSAGGSQCSVEGSPGFNTAIGCIPTNPDKLVKAVLTFVISISGGLAFLMMLLGAFQMLTSAGNPETLQAGRERFTQAIIGLLFIVFSVILLQIIGVDILGLRELRK